MIALDERVMQQTPTRVVYVRDRRCEWRTAPLTGREAADWRRRRSTRDLPVLATLAAHQMLTTDQLARLFWPDAALKVAQAGLRRLMDRRLALRWWQLVPTADGWRRRSCAWMLTRSGALLVAGELGLEPKPIVQRSYYADQGTRNVEHDLEAAEFFVRLAEAAAERADHGLYSWLGEVGIRRQVQLEQELGVTRAAGNLAPDGWGLLLVPAGSIALHLELDRGTERPAELGLKARRYLEHAARREHVLIVLPNSARERSVRAYLERAGAGDDPWGREVGVWTSTRQLLDQVGPIGRAWRGFASDDLVTLLELPARPRPEDLDVDQAIAKPAWWARRPAGGEGA